MLKTVEMSRAKKTAGIAVTYRAGAGEKYGTCPASCKMNSSGKGTEEVDAEYLNAVLDAVPRKGVSFTYSHFSWHLWAEKHCGRRYSVAQTAAETLCNPDRSRWFAAPQNIARGFPAAIVETACRYVPGWIVITLSDLQRMDPARKKQPTRRPAADAMPTPEIAASGGMKPRTPLNPTRPTRKKCSGS